VLCVWCATSKVFDYKTLLKNDDIQNKEVIPPDQPTSSERVGGIQIFVKTLEYGTISLDVEVSFTIEYVKKLVRKKVESMAEGYDVERLVAMFNVFSLLFNGKQIEDSQRLSDYKIQKGDTINTVFGLVGGGKRAITT